LLRPSRTALASTPRRLALQDEVRRHHGRDTQKRDLEVRGEASIDAAA
jgi:hypothetical protein